MNIHSSSGLTANLTLSIPKEGFGGTKVLIVGDVMLDRYILGAVSRISPEAPVPVLAVQQERSVAGGASNVALNVAGLKGNAYLVGVTGTDAQGDKLRDILDEQGVNTSGLLAIDKRPTTCKTRVMCANHQIVRLDEECVDELEGQASARLLQGAVELLDAGMDAVILSDYAKGLFGKRLTVQLIAECNARQIPVLVDPKKDDYSVYSGATCITPNQKEFKAAVTAMALAEESLSSAAFKLRDRLACRTLLVTQGAEGMTLFASDHSHHFPALAEEVFDVSGAGDTVIATVATCLAAHLDILTAVQLSNVAASLVVRRAGTAPIMWDDLHELLMAGMPREQAIDESRQSSQAKGRGKNLRAARAAV